MADEQQRNDDAVVHYEGGIPVFNTRLDKLEADAREAKDRDDEYKRKQLQLNSRLVWFTGLLAIVGVIGGVISAYQAHIADINAAAAQANAAAAEGMVGEMRKSGNDTHELAVQAKNQADRTKDVADRALLQANATNKLAGEAKRSADANRDAADAAHRAADTAYNTLVISNRPWVHATAFQISQPLTFNEKGATIEISGTLENVGHSPALHVISRIELVIVSMTKGVNDEIAERQNVLCDPLRNAARDLHDVTLFPGDKIPTGAVVGLSQDQIKAGLKSRETGSMRHSGYLSLAVLACVDYQVQFMPQHHQTRDAFDLGIPEGRVMWMGDLRPDGIQPDVKLIYFGQSAD